MDVIIDRPWSMRFGSQQQDAGPVGAMPHSP
jgi:hypothetical protein